MNNPPAWQSLPGETESTDIGSDLKDLTIETVLGEVSQNSIDARLNDSDKVVLKAYIVNLNDSDNIIHKAIMENLNFEWIKSLQDVTRIHSSIRNYLELESTHPSWNYQEDNINTKNIIMIRR